MVNRTPLRGSGGGSLSTARRSVPRRAARGGIDHRDDARPRNLVELLYIASQTWGTTVRLALLLLLMAVCIAAPPMLLTAAYSGKLLAVVTAEEAR